MIRKKSLFAVFLLLFLILALSFVSFVYAAIDPANSDDPLGIGISPDKIPQTPEDAANISLTYLQKEWTKIVAKNKYIGPMHNFFLNHQTAFIILFNEKYEFSLTFICIFVLWVFFAVLFGRLINAFGLLKMGLGWVVGVLCSVILAQIGLTKIITTSILTLIYARDLWWMRALLWATITIVLMIVFYLDQAVSQAIEQSKKKGKEQELEEEVKSGKAFRKGVEEGRKLLED